MGVSTIAAGKAFLQLLVDNKDFKSGLEQGLKEMKNFSVAALRIGAQIGGAGAALTAPFAASLKMFSDAGSQLADLKGRTGLTAQSLSELKFAAEQSGASLEDVTKAAREMQKNSLNPNTIFDVAKKIAAIEDPAKRATAAFDAWGSRAGQTMLGLLEDLPKLREQSHKLGLVWSEEMVQSADRLGDAGHAMSLQLQAVGHAIGFAVAPYVSELIEHVSKLMPSLISWLQHNGLLVVSFAAVGVSLTAVGAAITAVSGAALIMIPVLTAIASPAGLAAVGIASIGTALLTVLGHEGAFNAAIAAIETRLHSLGKTVGDTLAYLKATQDFAYAIAQSKSHADTKLVDPAAAARAEIADNRRRYGNPFGVGNDHSRQLTLAPDAAPVIDIFRGLSPGAFSLLPALLQGRLNDADRGPEKLGRIGVGGLPGFFGPALDPRLLLQPNLLGQLPESMKKISEDAQKQLAAFGRDTGVQFGGKLAEQIGGSTLADTREERMLQFDKDQLATLLRMETLLKASKPIVIGTK